jgi:hypothetical protein
MQLRQDYRLMPDPRGCPQPQQEAGYGSDEPCCAQAIAQSPAG